MFLSIKCYQIFCFCLQLFIVYVLYYYCKAHFFSEKELAYI